MAYYLKKEETITHYLAFDERIHSSVDNYLYYPSYASAPEENKSKRKTIETPGVF